MLQSYKKRKQMFLLGISLLLLSFIFLTYSICNYFQTKEKIDIFGENVTVSFTDEFHQFTSRLSKKDRLYFFQIYHGLHKAKASELQKTLFYQILLAVSLMGGAGTLLLYRKNITLNQSTPSTTKEDDKKPSIKDGK